MTTVPAPPRAAAIDEGLKPNEFLHVGPRKIYNPLTDRTIRERDRGYEELRESLAGVRTAEDLSPSVRDLLYRQGWLVDEGEDLSRSFYLKYVSLETHTVCNQSCYFCPVSVEPRDQHFMPTEFFEEIVDQLATHRATIEAVWLMIYNEPTLDKRFVDQCRTLLESGLPAAVNTNASGLTPAKIDEICDFGPLRLLSVNLSTDDRERYADDRGVDQLPQVLENLEYAKERPVAEEMVIVVLGHGDDRHRRDVTSIKERFAGSRFEIQTHRIMDRAGYLQIGDRPPASNSATQLCGCENIGSRPLQHLHITPHGRCVLCCEDYDEDYVVGDLNTETIEEVLTGERLALYRRWTYGLEEAPSDYMCRKCVFARHRR